MLVGGLIGEDRIGDDLDPGHGSVEFEQTAPYVIPGGDEPQAVEALFAHPLGRLLRIAEGIARPIAQYDAAGGPLPGQLQPVARVGQEILQVNVMIDARDKELAASSFAEQRDAAIQALTPAG